MWYSLLGVDVEDVLKKENVLEGDYVLSYNTDFFDLQAKLLHYVQAPELEQSDP